MIEIYIKYIFYWTVLKCIAVNVLLSQENYRCVLTVYVHVMGMAT